MLHASQSQLRQRGRPRKDVDVALAEDLLNQSWTLQEIGEYFQVRSDCFLRFAPVRFLTVRAQLKRCPHDLAKTTLLTGITCQHTSFYKSSTIRATLKGMAEQLATGWCRLLCLPEQTSGLQQLTRYRHCACMIP